MGLAMSPILWYSYPMIIYKLSVRKRDGSNLGAIVSSFKSPETNIQTLFFTTKEKAEIKSKQVIDAAIVLYGHMHEISTYVTEVVVAE